MMETYSVIGYWTDTNERYKLEYEASSAKAAEEAMLAKARAEDAVFAIAGTMLGTHTNADLYTAFVNPDDPANDHICSVQYVADEDEVTEWTVLGLVVAAYDWRWNAATNGERYLGVKMATHPRYAEDIARAEVAERGAFELKVCAVFRGVKARCESFPFGDNAVTSTQMVRLMR